MGIIIIVTSISQDISQAVFVGKQVVNKQYLKNGFVVKLIKKLLTNQTGKVDKFPSCKTSQSPMENC